MIRRSVEDFQKRREEMLRDIRAMGDRVEEMLRLAIEGFDRFRVGAPNEAIGKAEGIEGEAARLTAALVRLSEGAGEEQITVVQLYLVVVHHLQLTGECCRELSERVVAKISEGVLFSDKAFKEIKELSAQVRSLLHGAILAFLNNDEALFREVADSGSAVEKMINDSSSEHEKRLISGVCVVRSSAIFLDMLDAFRRIAGHAVSLALEKKI